MSKNLTPDELAAKLREAGIDPSQWGQMGGGGHRQIKSLVRLAGGLEKVKGLLEASVSQKQGEIQTLQEKLARLQHGGGS